MAAVGMTYPRIVVGGHDITGYVLSYSVHQDAREPVPTMVVQLALPEAAGIVEDPAVAEHARVELNGETRAALVELGWTPPE